jgi:hypothetical protein
MGVAGDIPDEGESPLVEGPGPSTDHQGPPSNPEKPTRPYESPDAGVSLAAPPCYLVEEASIVGEHEDRPLVAICLAENGEVDMAESRGSGPPGGLFVV